MSTERSILRVRERDHIHPQRKGETVIEVLRGGEVVATIYGSLEGLNVVSDLAPRNRAFLMEGAGPTPSWVLPLLAVGEACPWCGGVKLIRTPTEVVECPVCAGG